MEKKTSRNPSLSTGFSPSPSLHCQLWCLTWINNLCCRLCTRNTGSALCKTVWSCWCGASSFSLQGNFCTKLFKTYLCLRNVFRVFGRMWICILIIRRRRSPTLSWKIRLRASVSQSFNWLHLPLLKILWFCVIIIISLAKCEPLPQKVEMC